MILRQKRPLFLRREVANSPARFACDERMSIDCARLILGINSIAKASTFAAAYTSTDSRSLYGASSPTSAEPRRIAESSLVAGGDGP